jgi:hypothetical protein
MINYEKFYAEIKAAGLPIETMSLPEGSLPGAIQFPDVWVLFNPALTAGQITTLNNLYAAHDPVDYVALVAQGAEASAAAIPNWASWTLAQWNTYYNANISGTQVTAIATLADAKIVLGKMSTVIDSLAKMEIALRNKTFPKLQG